MIFSKRILSARFLFFSLTLFTWNHGFASETDSTNPFSVSGICRYAEHLYEQREYSESAVELSRCVFLRKEAGDSNLGVTAGHLALAYLRVGQKVSAFQSYRFAMEEWNQPDERERSAALQLGKEMAKGFLIKGQDEDALRSIQIYRATLIDSVNQASSLSLIYSAALIRLGNPSLALKHLDSLPAEPHSAFEVFRDSLKHYGIQMQNSNSKSPWIAGLLSTLVPGLGQVYVRRVVDGAVSALSLAFLGYQAYDGFSHDGWISPKGAIFGGASLSLYGGTIYGAVQGAKIANAKNRQHVAEKISFLVEFQLP